MIPWLAKPHQTGPRILEWARQYPQWVRLDAICQWSHTAYAITVSDFNIPESEKYKSLFAVPHAHEPAGTVACMNFLSQLLDGNGLDASPAGLDRHAILEKTLLTFIPDANPEGRSRAPADWWDGARYENEELLKFAFGIDEKGNRFKRVDRWRTDEESPSLIGIAYERIDETTYVEPNRDWGSSLFCLVHRLIERHSYDQFLDLHQTEFENSLYNCVLLLPVSWEDLPEAIRARSLKWADEITGVWRQVGGASPQPPQVLGYTGQQRAYFEERWGSLYRSFPCLTVEVQNNSPRTPPELQRQLSETAIEVSVKRLLNLPGK